MTVWRDPRPHENPRENEVWLRRLTNLPLLRRPDPGRRRSVSADASLARQRAAGEGFEVVTARGSGGTASPRASFSSRRFERVTGPRPLHVAAAWELLKSPRFSSVPRVK